MASDRSVVVIPRVFRSLGRINKQRINARRVSRQNQNRVELIDSLFSGRRIVFFGRKSHRLCLRQAVISRLADTRGMNIFSRKKVMNNKKSGQRRRLISVVNSLLGRDVGVEDKSNLKCQLRFYLIF